MAERKYAPDHSSWCHLNMPMLVRACNLDPNCDCDGTEPPEEIQSNGMAEPRSPRDDLVELLTWQRDRALAVVAEVCTCLSRESSDDKHESTCRVFYAEMVMLEKHPEFAG